jgi:hypothetical protein
MNVKKTNKPTSSTATPNRQPKQLIEMAGLEIRRRALSKELAHVNGEMSRLNLEIRVLGIEIPWLVRGPTWRNPLNNASLVLSVYAVPDR